MLKLYALLSVLVLASAYKVVDQVQTIIHPFPFAPERELLPVMYLRGLFYHISFSILAFIIWSLSVEYKRAVLIFALLTVGNVADYVLRNGVPYGHIGGVSITYTLIEAIIFLTVILWTSLK